MKLDRNKILRLQVFCSRSTIGTCTKDQSVISPSVRLSEIFRKQVMTINKNMYLDHSRRKSTENVKGIIYRSLDI